MKKIFTTLTMMCFFALATIAQDFTLTGTVVNANGGAVTNHQVCIYTDSAQTSFVYYNCVNTDNQGYFSVLIPGGSLAGPNIVFYLYTQSCNTYLY